MASDAVDRCQSLGRGGGWVPCSLSTSAPGLLTSKDRMTMRRGGLVKSLGGMGMRFTRYSHTTSMLSFLTAEMGMMGDESATVPATNLRICSYCSDASAGFTRSTCRPQHGRQSVRAVKAELRLGWLEVRHDGANIFPTRTKDPP